VTRNIAANVASLILKKLLDGHRTQTIAAVKPDIAGHALKMGVVDGRHKLPANEKVAELQRETYKKYISDALTICLYTLWVSQIKWLTQKFQQNKKKESLNLNGSSTILMPNYTYTVKSVLTVA
jgi:hypothetical protein